MHPVSIILYTLAAMASAVAFPEILARIPLPSIDPFVAVYAFAIVAPAFLFAVPRD